MIAGLCVPVYLYLIISLAFVFNLLLRGDNFLATFALFVTVLISVLLLLLCNYAFYVSAWTIVTVIFAIIIYMKS